MKTAYEAPRMILNRVCAEDVISTSGEKSLGVGEKGISENSFIDYQNS